MTLRIALIDDHQAFRQRLRELLKLDNDLEIVAEAGSGQELLELALTTEIDAACMDISMPGMNGIQATRQLLARQPGVRVIGLSAYADPLYVEGMMAAGAVGYFAKGDAGAGLVEALHQATRERPRFGPDIAIPATVRGAQLPGNATAHAAALGAKEQQVLRLIADGAEFAQLALSLSMDQALVPVYCRNLMRKLNLGSEAELRQYARELPNG